MAYLVKIGNSQGIRIPKPLVEQAHLEGKELKLQVVKNGILVAPIRGVREGWKKAIEKSIDVHGHETIDEEWLDPPLVLDDDLDG